MRRVELWGGAAKNDTRRRDIFGAITVERRLCETTFNLGDDAFSLSHGEDDSLSLSYREDESQYVRKHAIRGKCHIRS